MLVVVSMIVTSVDIRIQWFLYVLSVTSSLSVFKKVILGSYIETEAVVLTKSTHKKECWDT